MTDKSRPGWTPKGMAQGKAKDKDSRTESKRIMSEAKGDKVTTVYPKKLQVPPRTCKEHQD